MNVKWEDVKDDYVRFNERIKKLESTLLDVRAVLGIQKDKTCLGEGRAGDCAPWPIVDEVIDSINQALNKGKDNE